MSIIFSADSGFNTGRSLTYAQSTIPNSPLSGETWFNPTSGLILQHDGNTWRNGTGRFRRRVFPLTGGTVTVTGSVTSSVQDSTFRRINWTDSTSGDGRVVYNNNSTRIHVPFGNIVGHPPASIVRMQVDVQWRRLGKIRCYAAAGAVAANADLSIRGFGMRIDSTSGNSLITAQIHNGTTLYTSSTLKTISANDEFHSYEIIYSGNNTVSLYEDNVFLGSVVANSPIIQSITPIITFSAEANGATAGVNQLIDMHHLEMERLF